MNKMDFVGIITINRPKALNALNSEVLKELDACLDGINLETTRALILTGFWRKIICCWCRYWRNEYFN